MGHFAECAPLASTVKASLFDMHYSIWVVTISLIAMSISLCYSGWGIRSHSNSTLFSFFEHFDTSLDTLTRVRQLANQLWLWLWHVKSSTSFSTISTSGVCSYSQGHWPCIAYVVLSDYDNNCSSRTHILLHTRIDEAILGDIHRLIQEISWHVCYQCLAIHLLTWKALTRNS